MTGPEPADASSGTHTGGVDPRVGDRSSSEDPPPSSHVQIQATCLDTPFHGWMPMNIHSAVHMSWPNRAWPGGGEFLVLTFGKWDLCVACALLTHVRGVSVVRDRC